MMPKRALPGTCRPSTAMPSRVPVCLLLGKFWGMPHPISCSPGAWSFWALRNWDLETYLIPAEMLQEGNPGRVGWADLSTLQHGHLRQGKAWRGEEADPPAMSPPPRSPSARGHTPPGLAALAGRCPWHPGTHRAGKCTHGCWDRLCCEELGCGWARRWDAAAGRCPCVCVRVRVSARRAPGAGVHVPALAPARGKHGCVQINCMQITRTGELKKAPAGVMPSQAGVPAWGCRVAQKSSPAAACFPSAFTSSKPRHSTRHAKPRHRTWHSTQHAEPSHGTWHGTQHPNSLPQSWAFRGHVSGAGGGSSAVPPASPELAGEAAVGSAYTAADPSLGHLPTSPHPYLSPGWWGDCLSPHTADT